MRIAGIFFSPPVPRETPVAPDYEDEILVLPNKNEVLSPTNPRNTNPEWMLITRLMLKDHSSNSIRQVLNDKEA